MQFVNTKSKLNRNRICVIYRSIQNLPPDPMKFKKESGTEYKGKSPQNKIKINEIAREVIKRKRSTAPKIKTNEIDGEMSRGKDTLSSVEVDISKESDDEEGQEENKKLELLPYEITVFVIVIIAGDRKKFIIEMA